jgi:predicted transcriptional regulator
MTKRRLTVRLEPDWRSGIRATLRTGKAKTYQGETLAFETPAAFFGKLTERRWELVRALQGKEAMSIREIAGLVGRDIKRVHEDVAVLIELGLLERTDDGVACPFDRIHVDIELKAAA